MSCLYMSEQGARLGIDGGYFLVHEKNEMTRKIPSETLEYIAIFGNVQITTQAIKRCLCNGIIVNFFSTNGSYFGRLESTRHTNITRQRKQFSLSGDAGFSEAICKKIIEAKIHNQRVVLNRYAKKQTDTFEENEKQIRSAEQKIKRCETIEEIKGYEGIAAKYYFRGLAEFIEPDFKFDGRNRMPPKDPFNSMLSLGYTLLMHEFYGAITGKGMSPYAAFLHKDREKHPTLASDMMEEWRAIIVDSAVLSLIQGREITIDQFYTDTEETGAVLLTQSGFKTFIKKYEQKMLTETKYLEQSKGRSSYRRVIFEQVNALSQAIDQNNPDLYQAIRIR